MKRRQAPKLPVLNEHTGNVITWLWPRLLGQLCYAGNPPKPIFADSPRHPTLHPIVDILRDNQERLKKAA